jgi:ABC-type sulfate transport system permease subunit
MDTKFVERVLVRCVILGVAVLVIWFGFFLVADGLIYGIHGHFFGEITKRQFQVIHYSGMGLMKLFVAVFFFFPYVAIRWAGKGKMHAEKNETLGRPANS